MKVLRYEIIGAMLLSAVTCMIVIYSLEHQKTLAQDAKRDRPVAKLTAPRDDTVYLWNQPSQGYQSVVTLNPGVDLASLDVGILVPMTIRIEGIEVVPGKEKEAAKTFGDIAVGKLMTAALSGKSATDGMVEGDFWDGAQKGWLKEQLLKTKLWREKAKK